MSTLKTCGTCRHFGAGQQHYHNVPEGFALCGRIQHDRSRYEFRPASLEPACVVDGSGYFAALCVTTDFGCTEWEGK